MGRVDFELDFYALVAGTGRTHFIDIGKELEFSFFEAIRWEYPDDADISAFVGLEGNRDFLRLSFKSGTNAVFLCDLTGHYLAGAAGHGIVKQFGGEWKTPFFYVFGSSGDVLAVTDIGQIKTGGFFETSAGFLRFGSERDGFFVEIARGLIAAGLESFIAIGQEDFETGGFVFFF